MNEKPDITLIEPEFLRGMAKVLEEAISSKRYSRDSWKREEIDYAKKRMASLLRHSLNIVEGNLLDSESGLLNAYHIACNAMIIAHFNRKEHETRHRKSSNLERNTLPHNNQDHYFQKELFERGD